MKDREGRWQKGMGCTYDEKEVAWGVHLRRLGGEITWSSTGGWTIEKQSHLFGV